MLVLAASSIIELLVITFDCQITFWILLLLSSPHLFFSIFFCGSFFHTFLTSFFCVLHPENSVASLKEALIPVQNPAKARLLLHREGLHSLLHIRGKHILPTALQLI
eukprot:m.244470 g.244470  ORF g.244470 m.244470 type:complete len:107 (-) comp17148_c0_seq4:967-1287(-)